MTNEIDKQLDNNEKQLRKKIKKKVEEKKYQEGKRSLPLISHPFYP